VIIWINGAFGAGKTQTAYELHRRLPDSFVYDPENTGYFIRKNIPKELSKGDFQDFSLWREFNCRMLSYMSGEYGGTLIVPMTVVSRDYFAEMVGKLREDGVEVNHFSLCASKEVLRKRLRGRGERGNSWPVQQIDRCVEGLADEVFRHHLDTDRMGIEEVAETIAAMCGIVLQPNHKGYFGRKMDRIKTQFQHIRFFG
jgi:hypothetical protein